MTELPTLHQYKTQVDLMVATNELTVEQAVILTTVFKHHHEGTPTNIRYLMSVTNLNWVKVNNQLNGLVQRGAMKKIDKYWYSL